MNSDRWQLIEALYHRAAAQPEADRRAFLSAACPEDRTIIEEVESLLLHSGTADSLFDAPAIEHLARAIAADKNYGSSSLPAGAMLSHYRIHKAIGRGGMGVVYEAEDVKLGRLVALKLLPDYLASDEQALQRFEREARAASALNHPNICTVYEIDQAGRQRFIAIELLDGENLKERIGRGSLDIRELLRISIEICDALEAAHSSGIIHRDIKPANIFLTRRGMTKVLDFGAAKRLGFDANEAAGGSSTESAVPFTERLLTRPGSALGTVEYMSPEQADGQAADPRSDIYSLGAVIYEMATGRMPWLSDTLNDPNDTHGARQPRAMEALPHDVPTGLATIVAKALEADRAQRYQHVADMRVDLENLKRSLVRTPNRWRLLVAALAIAAMVAAFFVVAEREQPRATAVVGTSSAVLAHPIESLAVLPFRSMNGDPAEESFADAMTMALINNLTRLGSVRIVSSNSSRQYKDTHKTAREVARELNVGAVVEGAVSHLGDQVHASAQLIDGTSERNLWRGEYEHETRNVLLLQSEMAIAVAREVKGTLSNREQTALAARAQTVNPAAYEAYLRGVYFYENGGRDGFLKAEQSYRKAIDIDPSFAPAYTGAAENLSYQAYTNRLPPLPAWEQAEALLAKALALDPESPLAHALTGMILFQLRCDRSGGERELNRALEVSPGNMDALDYHSYFLMEVGRTTEGIVEKQRVLDNDPVSIGTGAELGLYLILAGRYDEAIEQLLKTLELNPNDSAALNRLGVAYSDKGEYDKAVAEFKKSLAAEPAAMTLGNLGYTYAQGHKRTDALRVVSQLTQMSKQRFISPALIARIYAALGDGELALSWLERAKTGDRPYVNDPGFDSLRSSARFTAIASKLRPSDNCPLM